MSKAHVFPFPTKEVTLRDLLPILIALRDQLQKQTDEQGTCIPFPRFDLGAAIAMKAPLGSDFPPLGKDEVRQSLTSAKAAFQSIHEMGNALGNLYPLIPPLFVGLK